MVVSQKPQDRMRRVAAEMRDISNGEQDPAIAKIMERAIVAAIDAAGRIEAREDRLMREAYSKR